jgi:uncharacterized protein YutE (UPF0331/DUF86 family)
LLVKPLKDGIVGGTRLRNLIVKNLEEISTEEMIQGLKELIAYFEKQKRLGNNEKELSTSFIP